LKRGECKMQAHYGYKDGSGDYFIIIDTDKCNGCKKCAEACPYGVLELIENEFDIEGGLMPKTVKLFINDVEVEVEEGKTILEAARKIDVYVPTICYHPDLPPPIEIKSVEAIYRGNEKIVNESSEKEFEGCRLCLIQVEEKRVARQSLALRTFRWRSVAAHSLEIVNWKGLRNTLE